MSGRIVCVALAIRMVVASWLIPVVWLTAALPVRAEPTTLECLIVPRSRVILSSPVEGTIEAIHVDRGDAVTKGQVVVQMESSVEKAAVEVARARAENTERVHESEVRLEYAERLLRRHTDLSESEVISSQKLDEITSSRELAIVGLELARKDLKLARLELRRAQAALALRTLRTPVDGVVVDRMLEPGEFAEQQEILEVAELDPLHVEVFVPIDFYGRITQGSSAEVTPEAPIGGRHDAVVRVVDPIADAASGTFRVRLELANPSFRIPAGVGCRVAFDDLSSETAS